MEVLIEADGCLIGSVVFIAHVDIVVAINSRAHDLRIPIIVMPQPIIPISMLGRGTY